MTPDEYTLGEHILSVGDGHKLYVHDWGKKSTKLPIIFLHGGPGGNCKDSNKQLFDPTKHRVIFFDQRGSGKSTPLGSIKNNSTDDLVNDINTISAKLGLEKFIITGASWGACLALVYAIHHPERVHSMVLRGIYTGTQEENDFILNGAYRDFFPDVWETFLSRTPKAHHNHPSEYHYKTAFGKDKSKAKKSIYAIAEAQHALLSLDDRHAPCNFEEFDPDAMKIEMHYISNNCFIPDKYIERNAHKLKMPVWFVQGRYDAICPPKTAYTLSKIIPNCELIWTTAGHANDRANYDVVRTLLLSMAE